MLELYEAHGRAELVHLAVDAGGDHAGLAGVAEVLQPVDAALGLRVLADERPALERVEHLGGVEAQHREVAVVQDAAVAHLDAEGVRGVVDDLQVVGVGDLLDAAHVARMPVAVHGEDGRRLRRDGRRDPVGVQVQGVRVDVDEDRPDPVPDQAVRGRDEGVRRRDDVTRDAELLQRAHQCDGRVAEQRDLRDAQPAAQRRLEPLVELPAVGEDLAVPDLLEVGQHLLEGRQVGRGDVDRRGHRAASPSNSKRKNGSAGLTPEASGSWSPSSVVCGIGSPENPAVWKVSMRSSPTMRTWSFWP